MFIVLEGSDGSGKTTQFKLLTERLKAAGHDIEVFDFPRYDEPSSYFVKRYLNGEYGPASEVSPFTASLFYALDRFEAAPQIRKSLAAGRIVLSNRYAGSNMAHQGSKFTKSGEQRGYFVWADSLEFQLLGIPRPDINIFLRVPAEEAFELIKKKSAREYTDKMHDEHEADIEHLRRSVATYDTLCRLFPKDYKPIECTKKGKIRPVTEINNLIWDTLKPLLPKPANPGRGAVVQLLERQKNTPRSPVTLTQDTKNVEIKDISLLAAVNLITDGASIDYMIKWPHVAQKTRLSYYIPQEFPPKLSTKYQKVMNQLLSLNKQLLKLGLKSAYLDMTVPLAALSDARITPGSKSIGGLLERAAAKKFSEAQQIAKQARVTLQEPQPLKQLISQIVPANFGPGAASEESPLRLVSTQPRNELDLLVDCLYPESNLGPIEIAAELEGWSYDQKSETLKTIARFDASSILEKCHYRFDVIEELLILLNLFPLLQPQELQVQSPTPRYGYRVPDEVEQTGAEDIFIACFDLSLELYSDIQAAGFEELAGYAVLAGHKQRCQFSLNGIQAMSKSTKNNNRSRQITSQIQAKIAEAHPLISQVLNELSTMSGANKDKKTSRTHRRSKTKG